MSKKEVHVGQSTVAYDHCIGCGICEVSCPHDAINMTITKYKEIIPQINDKCTECTICIKYCPHTNDKITKTMKKASESENPYNYGIENNNIYLAHDKDIQKRLLSASGGALSAFIKELLKNNIIEYVIHANMIENTIGNMHYEASVSTTIEEIDKKRSSFYSPISFEKVLKKFKDKEHRILLIGVPCVTRAVKHLFEKNKYYKKNNVFTAALACSHNVSSHFVDYIAESENISKKKSFKVNLRNKDNIKDANNFNNHYFQNNNKSTSLLKKNRFDTQFTKTWRSYYFAQNICFKCSDFWGADADLSVKDAWGKWSVDPLGKSIVVMRNKELERIFLETSSIDKSKLTKKETDSLQKVTTQFKHIDIKDRIEKKLFSYENITNGYLRKKITSKISKLLYSNIGYKGTNIIMKLFERSADFLKKMIPHRLVKIFKYTKEKPMHRIYILGGYGYSNVGDEAQLNTVLKNLEKYFPKYFKIVGTHNRTHTYKNHNHSTLFDSPREAFFDHNSNSTYQLKSKFDYIKFSVSFILIYLNSFLVRADLPTFFLNAKKAGLLNEIKNSDMIFFSGGGYLTGDTLSRLYDGILMILIAKNFDCKVVMTGQTIGLWNTKFNEWLAKKAFSKVDLITTRDPFSSLNELKKIGIFGDNISYCCDDALFCEEALNINNYYEMIKYDINDEYISFNIHYWGMKNLAEKEYYLEKVNSIIEYILQNTKYKIIFIPMVPSDEDAIDYYLDKYKNDNLFKLNYKYDFKVVRSVIKKSIVCITMKHHPIIFALGENTPSISLYYTDYYFHKNNGALSLFEFKDYNIDLNNLKMKDFEFKFNSILTNYDEIELRIKSKNKEIYDTQSDYYEKIKRCINDKL